MKNFGNKEVFAFSYELKENPYSECGENEPAWGVFQMWVNNKSVCTFSKNDKIHEYEWNLLYITEWLCKNRNNILYEKQFPLPRGLNEICYSLKCRIILFQLYPGGENENV